MRSNKERDITKTTYIHNSYKGRPSSCISKSIFSTKETILVSSLKFENTEDNIKIEDGEKPINICLPSCCANNHSVK